MFVSSSRQVLHARVSKAARGGGLWPGQTLLAHKFQAQGFSQQGAKEVAQGEAPKQPVDKLKVVNAPQPQPPTAMQAGGSGQAASFAGGPTQTAGQGSTNAVAMDRLALAKLKMSMALDAGQQAGQGIGF